MTIHPAFLEAAVVVLGVILLLVESFANLARKSLVAWLGVAGLGIVLALTFFPLTTPGPTPSALWNFYTADANAIFFKQIALITTIVVLIMSVEYRGIIARFIYGTDAQSGVAEFYTLPIFTCAGLMWMASAVDFVLIFVSLELVTISFYILVSYLRRNLSSLEAGVKYLILGALSTGFLVYGITWIYGVTGETNLTHIAAILPSLSAQEGPLFFGFALVLIALGFKIAVVPFQVWVPDVYQGAPTPITAFLSVGSKAAGFIVLLRFLETFTQAPFMREKIYLLLAILSGLTLIYGNFTALPQENFKRLLAYSSIAHAGYLLLALASLATPGAAFAINYYILGYLLMTLLSFTVLSVLANHLPGDHLSDFNGLARRSPGLALALMVAMLSLAGIPLTVGFLGKFLVFATAIQAGHYVLVGIGAVAVVSGFYYYLKIVRAMYWEPTENMTPIPVALPTRITLGVLVAGILILGVYPKPIYALQQTAKATAATPAIITPADVSSGTE